MIARKMERRVITKMKTKMTAIFATLMIALMAVGISYAMWSKTVYIYGTVETGEVDAEFSSVTCNDPFGTIDPGYDKDVGWCECIIGLYGDPQELDVIIHNAYPCYSVTVDYEIDNVGTIPVKIQTITLTNVNPEITVTVTGIAVGDQIEPGGSVWGDLEIHVEQSAAELATYYFDLEIYLVQWNEFQG